LRPTGNRGSTAQPRAQTKPAEVELAVTRRSYLANAFRAATFENLDLNRRRLVEDYVLIRMGTLVAIFLSSCRPSSLLVRS